jgi:hypothetical protein
MLEGCLDGIERKQGAKEVKGTADYIVPTMSQRLLNLSHGQANVNIAKM